MLHTMKSGTFQKSTQHIFLFNEALLSTVNKDIHFFSFLYCLIEVCHRLLDDKDIGNKNFLEKWEAKLLPNK